MDNFALKKGYETNAQILVHKLLNFFGIQVTIDRTITCQDTYNFMQFWSKSKSVIPTFILELKLHAIFTFLETFNFF